MNKYKLSALSGVAIGVGLLSSPTFSSDDVSLRFADWMPTSHPTVSQGAEVFIKRIEELSEGSMKVNYFPSEQIGKASDMLTLAKSGVADLVSIAPAYISDKLPLSGVIELPGAYENACSGSYAFAKLVSEEGVLAENEYSPNGVRVLFVGAQGPYRVLTADKKIDNLEDFSGLKVRTAGGPMDMLAQQMDAISVRLPGPDVLPSLTRGTLDGVFWPLQSVEPWGLTNALNHMTPNVSVGSFNIVYAISNKSWDKLSEDQQDVLVQAGKYATQEHCSYIESNEGKTVEELVKGGIESTELSQPDVEKVTEVYEFVSKEWAGNLDKRGLPGSQVVSDFSEAVISEEAN